MKTILFAFISLFSISVFSQQKHSLKGTVIDKGDRSPIPYASIIVKGTTIGTQTDEDGRFSIQNLLPGPYTLLVSFVGYKAEQTPEYLLTVKDLQIIVELEENKNELADVNVYPMPFRRSIESPVGLHVISTQEIEKALELTAIYPALYNLIRV